MDRQLDLLQPPTGTAHKPCRTSLPGLEVRFWPGLLPSAARMLERLLAETPWKQETISFYGRTHPIPRLTCWMGDPCCNYTYSGVRNRIEPWIPAVEGLRRQVEETAGCHFNSLLLNHYRDGRDKLDWHADDEPELDPDSPIASLSLGTPRTFRLKPRDPLATPAQPVSFELGEGDLLVMDPPTQQHWLHQVPRRLRITEPRINLTFRVIRPEAIRHV